MATKSVIPAPIVIHPPIPPVAEPDTFYVLADDTLTLSGLNGVLVNDFDNSAGTPSVHASAFSAPAHGVLTLSIDGGLTYTPNSGFSGVDTFTYLIGDSADSLTASAVATIDVIKPFLVAAADAFATTPNGVFTVDAAHGLLKNDLSGAGAIHATSFSQTAHGSLTVSLDGSLTYTPNAGYFGTDTFTYFITNGHATASAVATIDVVDAAPVANNDAYSARAGQQLVVGAAQGLLANDIDPGGSVHATSYSQPLHGSLNVSLDGGLTYTPNPGFTGVDTFVYFISDGAQTATATGTIDVVDQAPVAGADFYRFSLGSTTVVAAANGLLVNDFDPDATDSIHAASYSQPLHGSLNVSLDGSFTYIASPSYVGLDTFTYFITDGSLTSSAVVTLNDGGTALVANPDAYHGYAGTTLTVAAANGLLTNDYATALATRNPVHATSFSTPAHGSVNVSLDGSFTYVPDAGYVGADTFTYFITDTTHATASAVATVDVVRPSLVAAPDNFVTKAGQILMADAAHGLLANDLTTGGTLHATSFSQTTHGALSVSLDGAITYTPNAGFVGTDTFSYFISNTYGTASAVATIDVIDAPPVANNDSFSVRLGHTLVVGAAQGLLANDVDPGGTVHATSYSQPLHGSLNVSLDGGLTYTPNPGFTGVDTFVYFISDGTQTASATGTIDVAADAPLAGNDYFHVIENTTFVVAAPTGLLANDFDPDGNALHATSFSQPAHGTLSVSLDGSLTYTPAAGYTGADSFTYFISDSALTASAIAYLDVTTPAVACFVKGTRIETARGDVAVEDLEVGDRVVLASGGERPIVWIGCRNLNPSRHPSPGDVWPVRVAAHAFGEASPRRDLWLSPGHHLASEGALIAVSRLVNGRSVVQVQQDRVEYWHVELDAHDVLLAEGLPAESYLDTGNRTAFANGGAFVDAHPDFKPRHWAQTCLPIAFEGPAVAATRARLLARLAEAGCVVSREADAHVCVDDVRVAPLRLSETRLAFVLPAGGREIELRSRAFVPAHTMGESADLRALGLCVAALQIDGSPVALGDDRACPLGWREAEFEGETFRRRWTTGATPLPAGARIAILDLAGDGYYWREAGEDVSALSA